MPRLLVIMAVLYVGIAAPATIWFTWQKSEQLGVRDLKRTTTPALERAELSLLTAIEKLAVIPSIIARNESVIRLLASPSETDIDYANRLLTDFNKSTRAAGTFVMNAKGDVVAASNWDAPGTFVGRNFGFRPYFLSAMEGQPVRYFAIEVMDKEPGYYFSHPLRVGNRVVGVVVVKMGFGTIVESWVDDTFTTVVTDSNGVIFLASQPQWKLRSFTDSSSVEGERAYLRYAGADVVQIPFTEIEKLAKNSRKIHLIPDDAWIAATPKGALTIGVPITYLDMYRTLPNTGWRIHVMHEVEAWSNRSILAVLLVAVGLALVLAIGLGLFQWRMYGRQRDLFQQRELANLKTNEAEARSIIDNAHRGLLTLDRQHKIVSINTMAQTVFSVTPGEATERSFVEFIEAKDARAVTEALGKASWDEPNSEPLFQGEITGQRHNGETFALDLVIVALRIMKRRMFLINAHDLSERNHVFSELQIAAMVVDHALEGIMITDKSGKIISANPAFTAITEYQPAEYLGKDPSLLKSGRHDDQFYADMWTSLTEKGKWQGEIWNRRKGGEIFPEQLSITSLENKFGAVTGYVGIFSDITQRKQMEERLKDLVHIDALTNLANRPALMKHLEKTIARSRRRKTPSAVLFIDLDGFKQVNDTGGHEAGDRLLQEVADRLRGCLREEDLAARLGGDEFILVLNEVNGQDGATMVAKRSLEALDTPYTIDGNEYIVTGSIGIALYPDHGQDAEGLLNAADGAMYTAKNSGKNALRFAKRKAVD